MRSRSAFFVVERRGGLPISGTRESWDEVVRRLRRRRGFGRTDSVKPILARRISRTTHQPYWRREWLVVHHGEPPRMSPHHTYGKRDVDAVSAPCVDPPTAPPLPPRPRADPQEHDHAPRHSPGRRLLR